jgi:hypothetical protein
MDVAYVPALVHESYFFLSSQYLVTSPEIIGSLWT